MWLRLSSRSWNTIRQACISWERREVGRHEIMLGTGRFLRSLIQVVMISCTNSEVHKYAVLKCLLFPTTRPSETGISRCVGMKTAYPLTQDVALDTTLHTSGVFSKWNYSSMLHTKIRWCKKKSCFFFFAIYYYHWQSVTLSKVLAKSWDRGMATAYTRTKQPANVI